MTTVEPGASDVFTQGLRCRPGLDRVAGQQAGADHHARVGGVGAAGDRGDHDHAVVELERVPSSSVTSIASSVSGFAVATPPSAMRRARLAAAVGVVVARRVGGRERLVDRLVAVVELLGGVGIELLHRLQEAGLGASQRHPVLGALGPGEARLDVAEVELQGVGEGRILGVGVVEHPLLAGVGVDQLDRLGRAAGELQVAQRLGVDREDRAGRAELRRHVADRRPVGEPEGGEPGAEELDELRDHAPLAQHLGHGEDEVGGRRPLGQLAGELEAEHLRQQHRDRLAEHRRLGLDPADAPAEHAEAVDHRRVGVGADQRVGVGERLVLAAAAVDDLGDVLEVDLVADAGRRRDDAEVVEGLLAPLQERVALAVALEVALGVDREGALVAEGVDLHRVVDHQVDVDERVDRCRIAADLLHRVAHRGQVDDRRDAGEVLHQHPRRLERDLDAGLGLRVPLRDRLDVVAGDRLAVLEPQHVLQQHLDRVGQAGDVELLLQGIEAVDPVLAAAGLERVAGFEGVAAHRAQPSRDLFRWPASTFSETRLATPPLWVRPARPGAASPTWASIRWRNGATAISSLLRSIARTTAAETSAGVDVPRPGGGLAPDEANIPASRMKPGETSETPTPFRARSTRSPSANPRSPNLVAL